MRIYDISVPISATTPTYPGDPGVEIKQWTAIADGYAANVSFLHFGAHTATHVDAPAHFIEGARKIDALPIEVLIGPARVVRVPDEVITIDAEFIARSELRGVERVLFHTRNSHFWSEEDFHKDFTHLSSDGAQRLIE